MPMSIKHGGVWKEAEVHVKHSGVWKRAEVWVKQSGIWKLSAAVVSHVMSPATESIVGFGSSGSIPVSSVVTGGTVSSRSWGLVSSDGGSWAFSSNTANVNILISDVPASTTVTATIYCDAVVSGVTYRATGTYSFTNTSFE